MVCTTWFRSARAPPLALLVVPGTRLHYLPMIMAHPTLQLAQRRDAGAIASMSRRFIESGLEPSWTLARVERAIQHPDNVVLTARIGRELAGFAIMQFGDSTAHLNLLAVATGMRRRGIGRDLMEWLEQSATVAGTVTIGLECRVSNQNAVRFYRAVGYRETGIIPRYYQGTEDAVRMERDLRAASTAPG